MPDAQSMKAVIDFDCIEDECTATIQFNLMDAHANDGQVKCDACHHCYQFDDVFLGKLSQLKELVIAVQASEDILGSCNVAVTTPGGEIKVPYRLLLTRMNTLISLSVMDTTIDFNFRVEPLNDAAFK